MMEHTQMPTKQRGKRSGGKKGTKSTVRAAQKAPGSSTSLPSLVMPSPQGRSVSDVPDENHEVTSQQERC